MKRMRKPTKSDLVVERTVQDYMHTATADIVRKRGMIVTESAFLEKEVAELTARVTDIKARLASNEHMLKGLASVIGRRQ